MYHGHPEVCMQLCHRIKESTVTTCNDITDADECSIHLLLERGRDKCGYVANEAMWMESPTPCNQCCSHASWSCRGYYLCHAVAESYSFVGASTGAASAHEQHTRAPRRHDESPPASEHKNGESFGSCGAPRDRQRSKRPSNKPELRAQHYLQSCTY